MPSLEEMWRVIQEQKERIDTLEEENRRLQQRLEGTWTPEPAPDVATAPAAAPAPGDAAVADEEQARTSMNIYGHAMLDMGYRSNQIDPDWYDVMRPSKLPAFEDEFGDDGEFSTSVRQSRLGVRTNTPTALGDLKTIFEFELFGVGGDAGQTTFRLRHAWGELGQFGGGQTWSVFMDPDVFPNSIEYWGPNGMVFFRNIQARWTPWSDGDSRFAISLEQPGASGDRGDFADRVELEGVEGDEELPDLAAHLRLADDWGHVQLAGILRQIKWEDNNDDGVDLSGDETGWGLNLSTNVNLGPHVFRGSLVYGEGIQNYMNDSGADVGVIGQSVGTNLPVGADTIPLTALVAFLDLNWSDRWTSTIGYSIQDNNPRNGQSPDAFERGQYALANLLWHPVPQVFMGPELQWIRRDNFSDGFNADDYRIQFSMKYSFDYTLY